MKSHINGRADHDSTSSQQQQHQETPPAESFYLSKEEEFDWVDRNAFYERKDSTKGKSNSTHSHSTSSSSSQRFSMKSKSSIIGLPKAPQNSCKFRNGKAPTNVRLFPKRSRSKSSVQDAEPSSPKVSCMGRVRSRRQRLRQLSRQRSATATAAATAAAVKPSKSKFWMSFKSVLSLRCRDNQAVDTADGSTETASTPSQKSEKRKSSSNGTGVAEPHGMNDLKRFASGRRYDSLCVNDV